MRKLILTAAMLAGLVAPVVAQAYPGELRDDRRAVREERRELQDARRYGDRGDIREERRELQGARRELREDRAERRYRGGNYAYPRGYGYQAWNRGAYLPRAYWGGRYAIARPVGYGLPGAYRGTRWVRVGPDALLIRARNGAVLRVVRGLYY